MVKSKITMADINRIIALIDEYLELKELNREEANKISIYLETNGALSHSVPFLLFYVVIPKIYFNFAIHKSVST